VKHSKMEGNTKKCCAMLKFEDGSEIRTAIEFHIGHINIRGANPEFVDDLYPISMQLPELREEGILEGAEIWVAEEVAKLFPKRWPAGDFLQQEGSQDSAR